MSLYDFYMYLKHIEFSPENLEFYIWYGYLQGFAARGWWWSLTIAGLGTTRQSARGRRRV